MRHMICVLTKQNNIEQSRSILKFLKVIVSILSLDKLKTSDYLKHIINGCFEHSTENKTKLLNKIRNIIRKLSSRFDQSEDLELLRNNIPITDQPMLTHILREKRRNNRKVSDNNKNLLDSDDEDDDNNNIDDFNGEDDDEDGEEEEEDNNQRSRKRHKVQHVKDVVSNIPTNLNDLVGDSDHADNDDGNNNNKGERRENVKVDETGRIYVVETYDNDDDVGATAATGEPNNNSMDISSSNNKNLTNGNSKKRARLPGDEYRSKKCNGDVWKKGMLQPHAFIPLDAKLLSKRSYQDTVSQYSNVVKSKSRTNDTNNKGKNGRKMSSLNRNQRKARKKSNAS